MSFNALTFNILAEAYLKRDRYRNSPPEALEPAFRRGLLLDTLAAASADLVMLQEVEPAAFEAIRARLAQTGDFHATYEKRSARPDGSAILVRRGVMEVVESHRLDLEIDDQVAVVARLRQGQRELLVAASHLRWQPENTAPDQHEGRRQLIRIFEHLDGLDRHAPRLVAGDFNAISQSCVVEAGLSRGLQLSCRSQRPWDTCNINRRRRKLDYILYSPDSLTPTPGLLPRLERDTPMPSMTWPSDHLAVQVGFEWR